MSNRRNTQKHEHTRRTHLRRLWAFFFRPCITVLMLPLHYRAILSEAIIAIATRSVLTQAGVRFNLAESSHGGGKHLDCQQLLANT